MTALRILYVVYGELSVNVLESQLLPLWDGLIQSGCDLRVLMLVSPREILKVRKLRKRLSGVRNLSLHISIGGVGFPPRWPSLSAIAVRRAIARFAPSVVHCRGPVASALAAEGLNAIAESIRPALIYDARGDVSAELASYQGPDSIDRARVTEKYIRLQEMEREALSSSARLFAVSSRLAEVLKSRFRCEVQHEIFPCWTDATEQITENPSDRARLRTERSIPIDARVWVYGGSADAWQAVPTMLEGMKSILERSRLEFLILLSDVPEIMEDHARRIGLPQDRLLIRHSEKKDFHNWLKCADIGLLVRRHHPINRVACPMKFGEYIAAGVQVLVSSELGDISGWVETNRLGAVLKTNSAEGFIEALARLPMADTQERSRIAQFAKDELAFSKFLPKYINTYRALSKGLGEGEA